MNRQNPVRRSAALFVLLGGGFLAGVIGWSWSPAPADDDQQSELATFMRKKLTASSLILEGLTVEDADMIRRGSQSILEMSKAELWNVLLDEDYREFNRDFRSSMRKLEQAAADQNFDNALLRGGWTLGSRPVDLGRARIPALAIAADGDHICPPAAAHDRDPAGRPARAGAGCGPVRRPAARGRCVPRRHRGGRGPHARSTPCSATPTC